jgi:hypothetical protein
MALDNSRRPFLAIVLCAGLHYTMWQNESLATLVSPRLCPGRRGILAEI